MSGGPLHGAHVTLRPATDADVPHLQAVLAPPEVSRWWGAWDAARVRAELVGAGATTFLVLEQDVVAGLIQWWEERDPEHRHAGIDIALHPAHHGRGLGTDATLTLVGHLIDDLGHQRVTADPAVANTASVAMLRRAGFRPVGVMRAYERIGDGDWHDNLLMELLATDPWR